jgi:hypothetical protein
MMVDLIYAPSGLTIDDGFLERAESLEVHAVRMRVMSANERAGRERGPERVIEAR